MVKNYPYLNDYNFLDELFHFRVISYLTAITSLDWDQNELERVEGKVVSASFNVDGNSSLRRTGNLSILLNDEIRNLYNTKAFFSINKKINVEIGIKNVTNKYTDFPIIWFPIGIFIIQNISIQRSSSSAAISLQLQDKMCLLNGDCGGIINASTVFDTVETVDENGNIIISRPTIYQIIMELVNHFGKEPLHKIIISDLDSRVKQVMKWSGSSPLYMVQKEKQYQMTLNAKTYLKWKQQDWSDVPGNPFEYGRDVGYIYTDFTYPGDLISAAGDSVTKILDSIISVLGNYEYFYDVYGNFVFQEIKNYLNNSQSKLIIDKLNNNNGNLQANDYLLDISKGKSVYNFENSDLILSYSNAPNYTMIKNDFTIWGLKKGNNNAQTPLRYHLAIEEKPKVGNTYYAFSYIDPYDHLEKWHCPIMFDKKSDFPDIGAEGNFYYDQANNKIYTWGLEDNKNKYIQISAKIQRITTTDWRTELYFQGVAAEPFGTESNYYYPELKNEWPKIYEIKPDVYNSQTSSYENHSGFRPEYLQDITQINYFLDFIDSDSDVMNFSVNNIGRRGCVINDNNVNCVFEPSVPDVILIKESGSAAVDPDTGEPTTETSLLRKECQDRNQNYYQVPDSIYDLLITGGSFYSGYQTIRQLLHTYTSYNESISISCIPLYFLQPKTRITITDEQSGISGDYLINNFNINIDSSSSMSISATRALQKI